MNERQALKLKTREVAVAKGRNLYCIGLLVNHFDLFWLSMFWLTGTVETFKKNNDSFISEVLGSWLHKHRNSVRLFLLAQGFPLHLGYNCPLRKLATGQGW